LNDFLSKIKEINASKLTTSSRETETFFNIAKCILVYTKSNSPHPLLGAEKLGMGTSNTWNEVSIHSSRDFAIYPTGFTSP